MKEYLLFAWDTWEAAGGWQDFQSKHPSAEAAKAAANLLNRWNDNASIVELDWTTTGGIEVPSSFSLVFEGGRTDGAWYWSAR